MDWGEPTVLFTLAFECSLFDIDAMVTLLLAGCSDLLIDYILVSEFAEMVVALLG